MILKRKTKLALYRFGIICNFLFLVVSIPEALILNGELTQNNIIIGSLNYVWKSTCIISVLLLYYNLWLSGRKCPAFFPPLLFLNILANPIISIIFIYNGVLLQGRVLRRRSKFHFADSRKTAFFRYYAYLVCMWLNIGFYIAGICLFTTPFLAGWDTVSLIWDYVARFSVFFQIGFSISLIWNLIIAITKESSIRSFFILIFLGIFYNPFYCFKVLKNRWIRKPGCPPPPPADR